MLTHHAFSCAETTAGSARETREPVIGARSCVNVPDMSVETARTVAFRVNVPDGSALTHRE